MTEEERKEFDKEHRKVESAFNKQIADQFRTLLSGILDVFDKRELKDPATGKVLGGEKDDKSIVEQAVAFTPRRL